MRKLALYLLFMVMLSCCSTKRVFEWPQIVTDCTATNQNGYRYKLKQYEISPGTALQAIMPYIVEHCNEDLFVLGHRDSCLVINNIYHSEASKWLDKDYIRGVVLLECQYKIGFCLLTKDIRNLQYVNETGRDVYIQSRAITLPDNLLVWYSDSNHGTYFKGDMTGGERACKAFRINGTLVDSLTIEQLGLRYCNESH